MSWDRFSYICRKASVDYQSDESIADCLSRIEAEEATNLYGQPFKSNSWPKKILKDISAISDQEKAKDALETYKQLDLSRHLEEPMKFKRVFAYLGYITFVFFVTSGIYLAKVAPTMITFIEEMMGTEVSEYLGNYDFYIKLLVVAVFISLSLTLFVGLKIKSLFMFKFGVEKDLFFRLLIFPKLRTGYLNLIAILRSPIETQNNDDSSLSLHLKSVLESDMPASIELKKLAEIQMQAIMEQSEKQLKLMYAVVAVTILIAIYYFLTSAYSPIFIMGEVI